MSSAFGPHNFNLTDPAQPCCECDACGRRSQFVKLHARWFRLGFLPVFPIRVSGVMKCIHCGASPTQAQMSAEALTYYKSQRRTVFRRGNWFPWAVMGILLGSLVLLALKV